MRKVAKADVSPGLLCRSFRYSDLMVVSKPNSRGMVECLAHLPTENRPVTLPWQVLHY